MKVFVVHNIDNELVKVFSSADKAFAWVEDQCQFWAKNMGEECSLAENRRTRRHSDCDVSGREIPITTEYTLISCQSGSEYTITPMELE